MKFIAVSIFAFLVLFSGDGFALDDNNQSAKSKSEKIVALKPNRLPSQSVKKNNGIDAASAETEDKIEQFRLQNVTEHHKKSEETASSIIKKEEDTESGIIENIK